MISYKKHRYNMSGGGVMDNRAVPWPEQARLHVLVGYPGSGKTEFAVNLALELARLERPAALADLDTVNPYFRSRERQELLEQRGIRLVSNSRLCADADVPSVPAELNTLLEDENLCSVLDIGGGPVGARILARYRFRLAEQNLRICFVLNANRPATGTPEGALEALREIESAIGLPVTCIVHNTHLCGETGEEDIRFGAEVARQTAEAAGIPILCHVVHHTLAEKVADLEEPVFPVRLYMNKSWEEPGI